MTDEVCTEEEIVTNNGFDAIKQEDIVIDDSGSVFVDGDHVAEEVVDHGTTAVEAGGDLVSGGGLVNGEGMVEETLTMSTDEIRRAYEDGTIVFSNETTGVRDIFFPSRDTLLVTW